MESRELIEQTAAAWVVKRGQQGWNEVDETALQAWLASSVSHRAAYYRLDAGWQEAGRLKALAASPPEPIEAPQPQPDRSVSWSRHWRVPAAIAASVLLATVLALTVYIRSTAESYRTPVGGLAAVPLADGSTVTLNTDSRMSVAIGAEERRIDLRQGEAFFEVAKDANRPFVVVAGARKVVAVGTKFSVMRVAGDQLRVVVLEGIVRIEDGLGDQQHQKMRLSAGGIARVSDDGIIVEQQPPALTEDYLSWRSGFVAFHQTPLSEIAAEFNRYNTRKIVIDDADVAALRLGGNFRTNNVEGFLRLLEQSYPVEVRTQQGRIFIEQKLSE
ncbi:FecR family protein [Steroidobacter sp.]|uniref:FecR family protein n=1 Tax=Steroidobacter sp. TaxID=1978227 RepID=UPI001A3F9C6E|nr:FecR domain-containing protein [Steroidobacter sp.]MBL8270273.1 FecR domain-containing protein [Steroidobacter sp.]